MTQIITRLFSDEATAQRAVDRLIFEGVPQGACDVFGGGHSPDDLKAAMAKAEVHESAIDAYASRVASGSAVAVVRATYVPLGVAKLTRNMFAERGAIEVPGIVDDHYVPTRVDLSKRSSVLKNHPLMFSLPGDLEDMGRGPITPGFGMKLLKAKKTKRSAMSDGGRRMSRMFWPMPLLSRKNRRIKVMRGGRFMSRAFWPMPLLSDKPRRNKVIRGGGFPFSSRIGMRTVSRS